MADPTDDFSGLPILDELGDELHRAARRTEEGERSTRSRGGVSSRRGLSGGFRWPAMRPALLATTALLVLALPVILAVRMSGDPASRNAAQNPSAGAAATRDASALVSGTGPEETWTLSALEGGCVALEVAGDTLARTPCHDDTTRESTGSAAGPRGALEAEATAPSEFDATAVNGSRDGFVFGTVPKTVARVRVTLGGEAQVTVPARSVTVPGAEGERRVFVAALDDRITPDAPVRVAALDERDGVVAQSRLVRRR
jgi:hypothetical protein